MMAHVLPFLLLLVSVPAFADGGGQADEAAWELFGDGVRALPTPQADPQEARFRVGFLVDDERDLALDLVWGTDLGFVRLRPAPDTLYTATVRGALAARLAVLGEYSNLLATDFTGGMAFGARRGPRAAELFLYHESSHLGDEILEAGQRARIDYSREAARLLVAHGWTTGRVLGGGQLNLNAWPLELELGWVARVGAEQAFTLAGLCFSAALDVQAGHEGRWLYRAAAQLAVELGFPKLEPRRQRAFLELYSGAATLGQYHDEDQQHALVGLTMEL